MVLDGFLFELLFFLLLPSQRSTTKMFTFSRSLFYMSDMLIFCYTISSPHSTLTQQCIINSHNIYSQQQGEAVSDTNQMQKQATVQKRVNSCMIYDCFRPEIKILNICMVGISSLSGPIPYGTSGQGYPLFLMSQGFSHCMRDSPIV